MKELLIIFITVIIFIVTEKYNLNFTKFIFTFEKFKIIMKNVALILPFVTLYFNQSYFVDLLKEKKKQKRTKLSQNVKKFVAANQKWSCNHCQNVLDASYEIDHIIPIYQGGTNDIGNLQALCRNCHGKKTLNDNFKY